MAEIQRYETPEEAFNAFLPYIEGNVTAELLGSTDPLTCFVGLYSTEDKKYVCEFGLSTPGEAAYEGIESLAALVTGVKDELTYAAGNLGLTLEPFFYTTTHPSASEVLAELKSDPEYLSMDENSQAAVDVMLDTLVQDTGVQLNALTEEECDKFLGFYQQG